MLHEVICDEFKQKRIQFFPNLNTILGDEVGNNSIGKSTFLMILDYVFGGQDYIKKSTDVQRNVGNHIIQFSFILDNVQYHFSRDTDSPEIVNICDASYNIDSNMSLAEYHAFLKNNYKIDLSELTFRGIVSRYIRVYGRENLDEKRPLNTVASEKSGAPVTALLQLFGLYQVIANLEHLAQEKTNSVKAVKSAQKFSIIPKLGVRQYEANKKELLSLRAEEEELAKKLDQNLLDLDSVAALEVIQLKKELSTTRRQRGALLSQIYIVKQNLNHSQPLSKKKFEELLEFFPDANLKKLSEIEQFHSDLCSVLHSELNQERIRLEQCLDFAEQTITEFESRISEFTSSKSFSKVVLQRHAEIVTRIQNLHNENSRFEQEQDAVAAKKIASERLSTMRVEQLDYLQNSLNIKMSAINDFIYSGRKKAPTISFHDLQYNFETRDDTGTGTSYKGLVVFDLAVLALTQLPILIHDSVLLKQIADEALEKILQAYTKSEKQVFIALDKSTSYTPETQEILRKTVVLRLSMNGNELFGRSWNEKTKAENP